MFLAGKFRVALPGLAIATTICFSTFPTSTVAEVSSCPANFFKGEEPAVVRQSLLQRSSELCFDEFAILHSGLTKTPLWSAEHLSRDRVIDAKAIDREDVFHPEPRLPSMDRAELKDYQRSGYDRGHMSPSADMATVKGQDESFSLANMVPQNAKLNRNLWKDMESTVRALTKKYNDVYVVTGPAFVGDKFLRLNGRVIVPSHVFKAIYIPKVNAAAVWWADNSGDGTTYEVISLDQLKDRTGIDAFPSLDYMVKDSVAGLPKPQAQADRNMAQKSARSVDAGQTASIPRAEEQSWWGVVKKLMWALLQIIWKEIR